MLPLTIARPGEIAHIKKITGKDETVRHLENLGFLVGSDIIIVSELAGNLILNVKGTRIALDRAMANRIMI